MHLVCGMDRASSVSRSVLGAQPPLSCGSGGVICTLNRMQPIIDIVYIYIYILCCHGQRVELWGSTVVKWPGKKAS